MLRPGMTPGYYCVKYLAVALWHALLGSLGLGGRDVQLYTFLLATPVIKYNYFDRLNTPRKTKEFVLSVVGDIIAILVMHKVCLGLCATSVALFWLYPFAMAFNVIALEYISCLILGDDNYVVKVSSNPTDNLLILCVSIVNFWSSLAIPVFGTTPGWQQVLAIAVAHYLADLVFGLSHYVMHNVPSLWKRHMVHHQYHKDELTSFANFYCDLLDGLLMNCSIAITGALMHGVGAPFAHEIVQMEILYPALYTHSKYSHMPILQMYFWELDAFDMLMGRRRMSEFHHHHHTDSTAHFTMFGITPDSVLARICDPFLPGKKRVGTKPVKAQ